MDLIPFQRKRSISARDGLSVLQENKKLKVDEHSEDETCQQIKELAAKSPKVSQRSVQHFEASSFSRPNIFISPPRRFGKNVLCFQCRTALHGAFSLKPQRGRSNRASRKHHLKIFSFEQLQSAAKTCSMCSLTLLILSRDRGIMIMQAKKYSDSSFNPLSSYYEDGITDIDELLGNTRRVDLSLSFSFTRRSVSSPTSNLLLEFYASYKTGARLNSRSFSPISLTHGVNQSRLEEHLLAFTESESEHAMKLNIPLDPRLLVADKVNLMKEWLSTEVRHDFSHHLDFLPSRLLHIYKDGHIRLVRSTVEQSALVSDRERGILSYMALSHRWGVSQHFTSTRATVDKMFHGFSIDELPMTFKDAVQVATWLGLSYLWIDALCILQDDERDWEQESQRMGDIFGNAQVTVAVHCAAQDSDGFLAKSMSKRSTVEFKYSADTTIQICRRSNLEADVTNSQLCKRGWVLQERFMAMRTMHFTEGQVYFETTRGVQTEDGLLDLPVSDVPLSQRTVIDRSKFFSPSRAPHLRELFGFDQCQSQSSNSQSNGKPVASPLEWLDLIEMYSNCDLTKENDKLMAIAGMAQKIHHRTGIAYCAGIWGDRISQGLLWLPESIPLSSPICPRAPSWSWAALDGAIQFPDDVRMDDFNPTCKLLTINGASTNSNAGQVNWLNGPGALRLLAQVLNLSSAVVQWGNTELGPGPPRIGTLTDEMAVVPRITLKSFVPVRYVSWDNNRFIGWIAFDEENKYFDATSIVSGTKLPGLCFVKIGCRSPVPSVSHRERADRRNLGVFLVSAGQNREEYRRVGFGQLSCSALTRAMQRVITIV